MEREREREREGASWREVAREKIHLTLIEVNL